MNFDPTCARCPHCLSQKPLIRSGRVPFYLRPFGERLTCDACLHHFFWVRLLGVFIAMPEPRHSRPA
jgi:hypothetical protein